MPFSKVLQAELTGDSSVSLVVELSHLEPGEKTVVHTTVSQGDTIAEATALVTGASPAGRQRVTLAAVAQGGTFGPDEPLVTFSQATTVWTTHLKPAPGTGPGRHVWAAVDSDLTGTA